MIPTTYSTLRWDNYFLRHGPEFDVFWKKYLSYSNRDILFLVAKGFDPRMCCGIEAITEAGGLGKRDCIIIDFDEGATSPSRKYNPLVQQNSILLNKLLSNHKKIQKNIPMLSPEGRRVGSRNIANSISVTELNCYTDIVIDISSMPRSIYFPLVGSILTLTDNSSAFKGKKPNVHLIVAENVGLDTRIRDQGINFDASYLYGFTGSLGLQSFAHSAKIWIPVLGEKQERQLEKIYNLVHPDEICPVLPVPAANPRRTDDLLVEYRKLLFDNWGVDQRNFIYAAEQNPFELYRAIHRTVRRYNDSLKVLGGCQVIISALSSKLLSIGALLAAYELKDYGLGVGMAHVETQGYEIEKVDSLGRELPKTQLSTLWLAGDCYE